MWILRDCRKEIRGHRDLALDELPRRAHLRGMTEVLGSREGDWRGYAAAVLMVAASTLTGLILAPRWGNSAVDLVYLPAVLGSAVLAGLGPSLVAAASSALAYNYFFTAPYHTFRIHSPADVVTVIVLFLVAVVTSHLAASIRKQAELANAHAERNATIAGFARRLLSCRDEQEIAEVAVRDLSGLFDCNAVLLTGTSQPRAVASYPASIQLTPSDLAAAATVVATGAPAGRGITGVTTVEWQLHPICSGSTVIAVIGLARDDGVPPGNADQSPLIQSVIDQLALALERATLEASAREFATVRERDRLRSALLSTISHDLAPPLAAIGGGVRALRRDGASDKAIVSGISNEAAKLQRYLDNLLDLGSDADRRPIEAGGVTIDLFHRFVSRDGMDVHLTPKEYAVLAELAKHPGRVLTHDHLLRVAWGPAQEGQTEYLRVAVRALRQKLERDPSRPALILNEPAVGYRLAAT
jgi:two-component system sensor histidine kinase KdpD